MSFVDIALENQNEHYDISFENGDIKTTAGFETSLLLSIFCERRANVSEISLPEKRRGWWGNNFLDFADFEMGSKLWLLAQARATQLTANNSITYIEEALDWYILDNYLTKIIVNADFDETGALIILISLVIGQDIVLSKGFKLWQNTINELS